MKKVSILAVLSSLLLVSCFNPSKPPMLIFFIFSNSADSTYNSAIINTNVIVSSSGEITWLSHGIYKSSCDIDVEYFPFDVQICKLMWASWTYDGQSVRTFIFFLKKLQVLKISFLFIKPMIVVKMGQIVCVNLSHLKDEAND